MGLIPIEQVQTGDWVLTRSEATNQYSWQEVTHKIVTEKTAPVELTLWHDSGVVETIQTTDEHPFWVEGKGWTRADVLKIGEAITTGPSIESAVLDDSRAIVLSRSFHSSRTTVYNLSVATNPNFFIGTDGAWVHNSDNPCIRFTQSMNNRSEIIAEGPRIDKIDELVQKFGGTRKGWKKKKTWADDGLEPIPEPV